MSGAGPTEPVAGGRRNWEELARSARAAEASEEQQDDLRQLLSFEIDATPYAVPVERVREIVRMRSITPIPCVPPEVRGVISLRGEIVEVIDVRRRLALEPAEAARSTRIVVVTGDNGKVAGILVDAVREVLRLSEGEIRPVSTSESESVEALCSRGDQFVSLIDLDRILRIDADG